MDWLSALVGIVSATLGPLRRVRAPHRVHPAESARDEARLANFWMWILSQGAPIAVGRPLDRRALDAESIVPLRMSSEGPATARVRPLRAVYLQRMTHGIREVIPAVDGRWEHHRCSILVRWVTDDWCRIRVSLGHPLPSLPPPFRKCRDIPDMAVSSFVVESGSVRREGKQIHDCFLVRINSIDNNASESIASHTTVEAPKWRAISEGKSSWELI